jgi:guanylate kinase
MILKYHQEFKAILAHYHMSDEAKQAIEDLRLVLLIAPTSGGRNTTIRHLLFTGSYHYIVSDTTRPPRINDGVLEQNGEEYWFRSEEEILNDLKAGQYLEAELIHNQQVSGISIRELKKAKTEGKIAVTDVDLEGLHNVIKVKPDTKAVMIVPPSFDEWQKRIAQRGHMSLEENRRRLETAHKILSDGLQQNYYQFVISEHIEQSAAIIDAIANNKPNPHQDRARETISNIQEQLKQKLSSTHF